MSETRGQGTWVTKSETSGGTRKSEDPDVKRERKLIPIKKKTFCQMNIGHNPRLPSPTEDRGKGVDPNLQVGSEVICLEVQFSKWP